MSKQAPKVTDHFRASRTGVGAQHGGKPAKRAAEEAAPAQAVAPSAAQQQQEAADEAFLRQFDLDTRFGPCTGMTRLQRWERAINLGLNPPPEVPALVQRYGLDSSFNRNLFWHPY